MLRRICRENAPHLSGQCGVFVCPMRGAGGPDDCCYVGRRRWCRLYNNNNIFISFFLFIYIKAFFVVFLSEDVCKSLIFRIFDCFLKLFLCLFRAVFPCFLLIFERFLSIFLQILRVFQRKFIVFSSETVVFSPKFTRFSSEIIIFLPKNHPEQIKSDHLISLMKALRRLCCSVRKYSH